MSKVPKRLLATGLSSAICSKPWAPPSGHQICASEEEAAAALRDADAGLVHTSPITAVILDNASKCRALILGGVGYDHVDLELAAERGIAIANVPDYCVEEVSDHALALILALARGLIPLHMSSRRGEWDHLGGGRLSRIRGCRLGLYGFGRIARRLADKARGIGLAVMAFDPYVDRSEMVKRLGGRRQRAWPSFSAPRTSCRFIPTRPRRPKR